MSNPLKWFRKYERVLLGVFGVALMFAFTFSLGVSGIDPITDYFRGSAGGAQSRNPVVVSWKDGNLRESDFEQLRVGRNLMIQFSQSALQQAQARGGQRRVQAIPPNNSDGALLELAILSTQAEQMGIEITDDGVLDYLIQLTDGKLKPAEFSNVWQSITQGQMSDKQLLSLVRRELMAIQVRGMMQSGNYPVSPIRKWDFYNRLERRVKAEMMPLPVATYLDEAPEPTEAELKELYEKYKNQFAYPNSPEPGFKQRERAAFKFVKFDFNGFFEAESSLVSDQEVAAYYDQHRDEFREQSFLEEDLSLDKSEDDEPVPDAVDALEPSDNIDATQATDGTDPVQEDQSEVPLPPASVPDDAAADPDSPPAGELSDAHAADEMPADEMPADEMPADEMPADEMPADEMPADEMPPDEMAPDEMAPDGNTPDDGDAPEVAPDDGEAQDMVPDDQSEGQSEGEEDSPPVATRSPQPPAAEASEPDATEGDEATMNAEDAEGESTGEDASTGEPEVGVSAEAEDFGEPSGEQPAAGRTEDSEQPEAVGKFQPLEKVADEIKRNLARPRAQAKLEQALARTRSKLERYYREHVFYEIQKDKNSEVTPPELPDLSDIEAPYPLQIESLPLSDELEVGQTEIGNAYDLRFTPSGQWSQTMFADVAYGQSVLLYKAQEFPTSDAAATRFLFWKTETQDAYVPEFKEVRQQVESVWKGQQAVDIALAAAEQKAVQARQSGESLVITLGSEGQSSFLTDEITWMTGGNIPLDNSTMPRPTPIPGVDAPGYDLYRTLFSLGEGEVGVALNQPKDTVYLIRVIEQSPPLSVRQEGFLENAAMIPGILYIQLDENQRDLASTYRDLLDRNGVEWKREPREGGA